MASTQSGQVQLSKLIFTHNWEDPAMDEKILQIKKGDTVFTITSGGCNSLGFLRFNPSAIYCVDINPAQTYLMELKQAVFRHLDHDGLLEFIGLRKSSKRIQTFHELRKDLSPGARQFWDEKSDIVNKGLFMNGRYERFVRIAGRLLRLLQGPGKARRLFSLSSLEEQKLFFINKWDNARWRWIFNTMFNKKRLAKKGLNADYFHFDDGSSSFSESFQRRAGHAIADLPVKSNYFLSLYLFGHYQDEENIPAYLKKENFEAIKQNIDRIHPVTADSKYWLEQQKPDLFDALALSNICELMDDHDTIKLFTEVIRTAKPNARIVFRNLMIPREVPEIMRDTIVKNETLSKEVQYHDRSFVYGKVAGYTICK